MHVRQAFTRHGRIGRAEFWFIHVGVTSAGWLLKTSALPGGGAAAVLAGQLLLSWLTWAATVKRLHDIGRDGWFLAKVVAASAAAAALLVLTAEPDARLGGWPGLVLGLPLLMVGVYMSYLTGWKCGSDLPNVHGAPHSGSVRSPG